MNPLAVSLPLFTSQKVPAEKPRCKSGFRRVKACFFARKLTPKGATAACICQFAMNIRTYKLRRSRQTYKSLLRKDCKMKSLFPRKTLCSAVLLVMMIGSLSTAAQEAKESHTGLPLHPGLTFQQEVDSPVCGKKTAINLYDTPASATLS